MVRRKVALFAPNLLGGGAERIISILAKDLFEKGFAVDLLLGEAAGPYLKDIPSNLNVVDFDCRKTIFTLPKLINYLQKQRPQVLFSSLEHSSTIAFWAIKLAGVNTKVIIRQPSMLRPVYRKRSLSAKLRQSFLLWSARKWAYKVVATSQVMADEFISLSGISPEKVAVIYNPLPIEKIRQESNKHLDHPWFQDGEPPVVLAVGRLVCVKDFETLIKAFELVKKEFDARLLILGEGPLRYDLESLIGKLDLESYVQMPGFKGNPFNYMKRSKIFVVSSLWEGFPNAMVEAMACGTKIVSTSCSGGAAEILGHGRWGRLTPIKGHEEMAIGILDALKREDFPNPDIRAMDFKIENVMSQYVDIFKI